MRKIDEIALAGLLHDIGKFAQRADCYLLKPHLYPVKTYHYTHAAYTAQVLHELPFNLDDESADACAMHHEPNNDLAWLIAAADRMASGFEREEFLAYNEAVDNEDFKKQRLWHLFDESKRFKIDTLNPENLTPQNDNAITNEYDALWNGFVDDLQKIKDIGNSASDFFTIDYLLKKFTTFIPSSTSFKKGNFSAVKANIPLYEHAKATAIFSGTLWALHEQGNKNIVNYYKDKTGDIAQQDLLMICGDFFGIQKFIFDKVEAKHASKILRAKSAYIQLLTKIIAFYIVEQLGLSYQNIISTSAGKFEILGINTPEAIEILAKVQQKVDSFFIKHFFAETGMGISKVPCALEDFIVKDRYRTILRSRIDKAVEASKFKKFDLLRTEPVMNYDTSITNKTLCPLCHKRKATTTNGHCDICDDFVKIGQKLASQNFMKITKHEGHGSIPIFGDFYIQFSDYVDVDNDLAIYDIQKDFAFHGFAKWELSSYVKKDKDRVVDFEKLAKNSVNNGYDTEGKRIHGVEALMSLKGDVDNMGNYIKNSETTSSFARFNFFSRMVDYFFSVKATTMMEGRNLYTVFAGGDDIFILGAWDEVIGFAKELREAFMEFAGKTGLSLSVGLVMTKSNKPINFVAHSAEEVLEESKAVGGKDAISLFGETVKWDTYTTSKGVGSFLQTLQDFDEQVLPVNTAFCYRLLTLASISKNVTLDPVNTIWKSKLAYSYCRNIIDPLGQDSHMKNQALQFLNTLNNAIENYPSGFKMKLCEHIYTNRRH